MQRLFAIFLLSFVSSTSLKVKDSQSASSQSSKAFQRIHNSFTGHLGNENQRGMSNVHLGNSEIASGIAELESSAKKKIEADIKYYEGLLHLTKGSKSQLPLAKLKKFVKASFEHKDDLEKKGLASLSKIDGGSKKMAMGLFEISDSTSQQSKQLKTEQQIGEYFSMFANCIQKMPLLWHTSYEAASFCRVYAYTCNNLWPENLHSEINEGTFCIVNTYEQTADPDQVHATQLMYQSLLATVIAPFYDFLMSYFAYIPTWTPNKLYSCAHKASDKFQLKCMMQNMKSTMKEVGDTPPIMSGLTSKQSLQLLKKAERITLSLDLLKHSENVMQGLIEMMSKSINFTSIWDIGIPGPLLNSLGHQTYKFSAAQGFVGPVSPQYRFPWDHVQPGLQMTAVKLAEDDPMAVCNDGSSAIMYLNENSRSKFHFHIDGGFFCYDKASCLMRVKLSPAQASTNGWESEKHGSGMFDPHLGGFPNYTHGSVGYCSSDAWMGQVDIEEFEMVGGTKLPHGKKGTFFRGFTITQAILKRYIKMGMGSSAGQELFVSGCSAGSIAATAMADSWPSRLEKLAQEMAVEPFYVPYVWNLLDGAPIVSPPTPFEGHLTIFEYAMKLVDQLYGPGRGTDPSAFLNKNCAAARSSNPGECVWTTTVLPYIRLPNLILVQLWDNFVTGDQFFFFAPGNHFQYKEGLNLVKMTREVMSKVTKSQNYFAIGCGDHCISDNPNFWRMMPPTAPGADSTLSAKDMSIATRDGKTFRVVADKCDNYNCGCFAQGPAYTKLGAAALYFEMLQNMTHLPGYLGSGTSLALAADQTYNLGQLLLSP